MNAKSFLFDRKLRDWKVELQYRLDIEDYCQEKNLKSVAKNIVDSEPYQRAIMMLSVMVKKKRDVRTYAGYIRLIWESIQDEINKFWDE